MAPPDNGKVNSTKQTPKADPYILFDKESEQIVLGHLACAFDEDEIDLALSQLGIQDFFLVPHREIFRIIRNMADEGEPYTASALVERVRQHSTEAHAALLQFYERSNWAGASFEASVMRLRHLSGRRTLQVLGNKLVTEAVDEFIPFSETLSTTMLQVLAIQKAYEPKSDPLVNLQPLKPEPATWLWQPYLPFGKLSILGGQPGAGKSYLSLKIASAVTRGFGLPGYSQPPMKVLIFVSEDGLADTVKPRLLMQGADCSLIYGVTAPVNLTPSGVFRIENLIRESGARLVIFDPLVSLMAGINMNASNEVRIILQHFIDLAESLDIALLLVGHLHKGSVDAGKANNRLAGSIDFSAAARSIIQVDSDPNTPEQRVVFHTKSNLGKTGENLQFRIIEQPDSNIGRVEFEGISDLDINEVMQAATLSRKGQAAKQAKKFVRAMLSDGPKPAALIEDMGRKMGFSESTLRRAKKSLRVLNKRDEYQGAYTLELPADLED